MAQRLVDEDLADRGADAGHLEPVRGQGLLHGVQLGIVELENVDTPGTAGLLELQAQSGRDLALDGEVVVNLVSESGECPHACLLGCLRLTSHAHDVRRNSAQSG